MSHLSKISEVTAVLCVCTTTHTSTMPKEQIRKRGKRKPKNAEEDFAPPPQAAPQPVEEEQQPFQHEAPVAGPSGIHPARAALLAGRRLPPSEMPAPEPVEDEQVLEWARDSRVDSDIPFGMLDPDVKAYFRTVDDQIKDWEGVVSVGEEREGKYNLHRPDSC